ncbi:T9SS type A sorting domain-containing protein [candidate division KSB1 bacterium]|nr:T9SS type A sorting domain-containing protein [candidate division KSB1 bacterium]
MHKIILVLLLTLPTFSRAQLPIDAQSLQSGHQALAARKSKFYQKLQSGLTRETPNQKQYDVSYYRLDLDLNPTTRMLTGSVQVVGRVLAASLDYIELNLSNNMQVQEVFQDSVPRHYSQQNNLLTIQLPRAVNQNAYFSLGIKYRGTPSQSGFGAFGFNQYRNQPMIWSLSEPFGARNWWPCKDFPSDKADSVDINITVPANLIVASNGALKQVVLQGEKKTYYWQERYPIVTYLVSIAIYPYRVYSDWFKYSDTDSMEIQFYIFPDHYNLNYPNYAKTKMMLKAFSELFGLYPFIKEKYGHAEFLWGGGMEHQTITSLGGSSEWLIAHELSHQWWGDMITCESFHHIWLNEGFATYCEGLWYEYLHGVAGLHQYMETTRYWGPGTIFVENPEQEEIFDGNLSYHKGSWVLHMLRHVMGDANFFTLLRTYAQHPIHRHGTVTTEQFQALAEEISGLNLAQFFQAWIYKEGFPHFTYSWRSHRNPDGSYAVSGAINQIQTLGPVFHLPIDVTIQTVAGETTLVVPLTTALTSFQCTLRTEPKEVQLDQANWILCQKEKISRPTLTFQHARIHDLDGNHNERLDAGESIELDVDLWHQGSQLSGVVGVLTCNDPNIIIHVAQVPFKENSDLTTLQTATPFRFEVLNTALPHTVEFHLATGSDQGYRFSGDFYLTIGQGTILLVDDDGGENYELFYQRMAAQKQQAVDCWEIERQGLPEDTLVHYELVFWFTGNDSVTSLTHAEQTLVRNFIDRGGRLAISGANIGRDLMNNENSADSAFYRDYLHAQLVSDQTASQIIIGTKQDPISNGLTIFFTGNYGGANNQHSPSVIAPFNSSVTFLKYLNDENAAAIRSDHVVNHSRLVYFAFGLEGIAGPRADTAPELFLKTMAWLAGATSDIEPNWLADKILPAQSQLKANFPNPFNPVTKIEYELSETGPISLQIFNILGEKIRSLVEIQQAPGVYQVVWDGKDDVGHAVGSGVYFYQLETPQYSTFKKMLLLR